MLVTIAIPKRRRRGLKVYTVVKASAVYVLRVAAVWGCTLAGGPLSVRVFDVTVTRCRRFLLRRSHLPVSIKHDIIDC